jgi:hypothetical protein
VLAAQLAGEMSATASCRLTGAAVQLHAVLSSSHLQNWAVNAAAHLVLVLLLRLLGGWAQEATKVHEASS